MQQNKATVDLREDAVYIIQDGQKTKIKAKQFGTDTIIWKNGKVLDVERSERTRIQGQEVI